MYDLLIRGGDAVLPETDGVRADIAVSGGKIAGILAPGNGAGARETLDAGGLVVFPGVIDVHLHLGHGHDIAQPRVPEDAASETAAAAVGGVTTMIPYWMATEPFEVIFDDVRTVTEGGARIDFSYHFIISTEAQLAAVPRYVRDIGVTSFKIFMNNRGGEGKRLGLPDIDDGFLFRLCEAAAEHGGLVCPHPENIEVAWVLRDRTSMRDEGDLPFRPLLAGARLELPPLSPGPYAVTFLETQNGHVLAESQIETDGSPLRLDLPAFRHDLAIAVTPSVVAP